MKFAFLNEVLEEEVYIEQPFDYEVKGQEASTKVEEGPLWVKASTKSIE